MLCNNKVIIIMNDESGTNIIEAVVDYSVVTLIFQHETEDTE